MLATLWYSWHICEILSQGTKLWSMDVQLYKRPPTSFPGKLWASAGTPLRTLWKWCCSWTSHHPSAWLSASAAPPTALQHHFDGNFWDHFRFQPLPWPSSIFFPWLFSSLSLHWLFSLLWPWLWLLQKPCQQRVCAEFDHAGRVPLVGVSALGRLCLQKAKATNLRHNFASVRSMLLLHSISFYFHLFQKKTSQYYSSSRQSKKFVKWLDLLQHVNGLLSKFDLALFSLILNWIPCKDAHNGFWLDHPGRAAIIALELIANTVHDHNAHCDTMIHRCRTCRQSRLSHRNPHRHHNSHHTLACRTFRATRKQGNDNIARPETKNEKDRANGSGWDLEIYKKNEKCKHMWKLYIKIYKNVKKCKHMWKLYKTERGSANRPVKQWSWIFPGRPPLPNPSISEGDPCADGTLSFPLHHASPWACDSWTWCRLWNPTLPSIEWRYLM